MNSQRPLIGTVAPAWLCLAFLSGAHGAEVSTIRGTVSIDRNGIPQVTECNTKRVIPFGTMASAAYFDFTRFYSKISGDGRVATVVEVTGELAQTSSSKGELILTSPRISAYRWGTCESAPSSTDDPIALAELLKDLKRKLDRFRAIPKGQVPYEFDPPLDNLIGATRKDIWEALGRPDVCDSEEGIYFDEEATLENCDNSDEWSYHFCSKEPLMFGGGFGMELAFNWNDKVMFAAWQGYR